MKSPSPRPIGRPRPRLSGSGRFELGTMSVGKAFEDPMAPELRTRDVSRHQGNSPRYGQNPICQAWDARIATYGAIVTYSNLH